MVLPKKWQIINSDGDSPADCSENNRDEWSVYLTCPLSSGNSSVMLNLFRKEVSKDNTVIGTLLSADNLNRVAKTVPRPPRPAEPIKFEDSTPQAENCGTGFVKGSDGSCVLEVKLYAKDNMTFAEAKAWAERNGWALATEEQVNEAFQKAGLNAFAYARIATGNMCVVVQADVSIFKRGTNCNNNGGNQGFLYVLKDANTGQTGGTATNPPPAPANNAAAVRQYLDNLRYSEAQLLADPTGDAEVVPAPKGKLPPKVGSGAVIVCTEVRKPCGC